MRFLKQAYRGLVVVFLSLAFVQAVQADLKLDVDDSLMPEQAVEYPFVYPFNGKSHIQDQWSMNPKYGGDSFGTLIGLDLNKLKYQGPIKDANYIWHLAGENWVYGKNPYETEGKSIYATNNGVVVFSGQHPAGPSLVIIKHKARAGEFFQIPSFQESYSLAKRVKENYNFEVREKEFIYSYYLNLGEDNLVKLGKQVKRGEIIGKIFSSDDAYDYPPYLHFEIWSSLKSEESDANIDPNIFDPPGYEQYHFGHNLKKLVQPSLFIESENSFDRITATVFDYKTKKKRAEVSENGKLRLYASGSELLVPGRFAIAIREVLQYIQNKFNFNSFDNKGSHFTLFVDSEDTYAHISDSHLYFRKDDEPIAVAHEFFHLLSASFQVRSYNISQNILDEVSSSNEALSDTFAALSQYPLALDEKWYIGNKNTSCYSFSVTKRNIEDPRDTCHRDHASLIDQKICFLCPRETDRYQNSTILSHAFYLLTEGGVNRTSEISVNGIGADKVEQILFRSYPHLVKANMHLLSFQFLRNSVLKSCDELSKQGSFGVNKNDCYEVNKAFKAVGITGPSNTKIEDSSIYVNNHFYNSNSILIPEFTIQAPSNYNHYIVELTTHPKYFNAKNRSKRNPQNFFSSYDVQGFITGSTYQIPSSLWDALRFNASKKVDYQDGETGLPKDFKENIKGRIYYRVIAYPYEDINIESNNLSYSYYEGYKIAPNSLMVCDALDCESEEFRSIDYPFLEDLPKLFDPDYSQIPTDEALFEAELVEQSPSSDILVELSPGQASEFSLTLKNIGNTPWVNQGGVGSPQLLNLFYVELRSVGPEGNLEDSLLYDRDSWINRQRIGGSLEEKEVLPGEIGHFNFKVAYPFDSVQDREEACFDLYFAGPRTYSNSQSPYCFRIKDHNSSGSSSGDNEDPVLEPEPEPVLELATHGISFSTYNIQLKEGESRAFKIYFTYNDGSKLSPSSNEVKWIINGLYQEDIDQSVWGYISKGSGDEYIYHAPTKMPPGVALILGIPVDHDKADYEYYPYILWANTSPSKSLFSVDSHFGGARLGSVIGLSIADLDKNGFDDLFVSNAYRSSQNSIWLNQGGSITTASVPDNFKSQDAGYMVWGDYNTDTFTDAWLYGRSTIAWLQNNGNSFGPPVDFSYLSPRGFWRTVFDQNNNGKLDTFGGGSYRDRYSPSVADFNNDGFLDVFSEGRLYKNINGKLQAVHGLIEKENELGKGSAVWGDLDNDGFLDFIFLAHKPYQSSYIYRNINGQSFKRAGQLADALHAIVVDVNNDGLLDVVMNNANSHKGFVKLYLNRGLISQTNAQGETQQIMHFDNIHDLRVLYGDTVYNQVYGLRMAWSDIDNDQDIDIFVADHEHSGSSELLKNNANDKNALVLKIYGKANIYGTQVRFYELGTDKFAGLRQVEAAYGGAQNSQAVHFAMPGNNGSKKYYAEITYPGAVKARTGELSLGQTYFIVHGQESEPLTQIPSKPKIQFSTIVNPTVAEGREIKIPFTVSSENASVVNNYQVEALGNNKHMRIERTAPGSYNLIYVPTRDTVVKPRYGSRYQHYSKQVTLVVKASNAFGGSAMASPPNITVWDAMNDGDFEHYNGVIKKLYSGTNIHDVEVDSKANVYIADNYGVVKVDADGSSKQVYNGYVKHLTIDQNDQIYMIAQQCTGSGRYRRCGPDQLKRFNLENNSLLEKQIYNLPSSFSYVNDILVSDDGSAFYAIVSGKYIYVYHPSSNFSYETYNSRHYSSYMNGLAVGPNQRLWVSDGTYGYVHQVKGSYKDRYKISRPQSIASKNGEIYFVSNSTSMYRYRGYNQQAERIAGTGGYNSRFPYRVYDGEIAMNSKLRIDKIAVSSDGTLYFINRENLVKLDNTR